MLNNKNILARHEYLEAFGEKYEKGLAELLENLEAFGPDPVSPDPSSLDVEDERTFEDLMDDELEKVENVLYKTLGVDPKNPNFEIRKYESEAGEEARIPGKIEIRVLKTDRENVFLQELKFSDGKVRWVVGGDADI